MPIPPFDEQGFLPPGVHDCTLEEIKVRFGNFQQTDRRPALFRKLESLIMEIRAVSMARWLVIDGSFGTAKAYPNDIDLVLVLNRSHDIDADLPPAQYNLVSKRAVQKRFGFDMLAVREGTVEYTEAVAFFAQVRGVRAARKGMLRLTL